MVCRRSPLAMITIGSPPKRSRYFCVASKERLGLSISVSVDVLLCRLVIAARAPANASNAARASVSRGRLPAAAAMRAKRFSLRSEAYGAFRGDLRGLWTTCTTAERDLVINGRPARRLALGA